MKYLMFVATDTEPDTDPSAAPDIEAWFEDVNDRGKWVMGDRLRPREDATTVRVRSGELLVTAGRSPSPRSGWSDSTCSSATTWTRRSRLPPSTRWPTTAASRSGRSGRSTRTEQSTTTFPVAPLAPATPQPPSRR